MMESGLVVKGWWGGERNLQKLRDRGALMWSVEPGERVHRWEAMRACRRGGFAGVCTATCLRAHVLHHRQVWVRVGGAGWRVRVPDAVDLLLLVAVEQELLSKLHLKVSCDALHDVFVAQTVHDDKHVLGL